jgi:hypothetical protein
LQAWELEREVKREVTAFEFHPNNMNGEGGTLLVPESS